MLATIAKSAENAVALHYGDLPFPVDNGIGE